jgi:hypothetical protein
MPPPGRARRRRGLGIFPLPETMGMGIFKEFRDFIIRGNAIDLAVGIIIGAAFGAVVNSLVKDVVMPPIGCNRPCPRVRFIPSPA